MTDPLLMRGNQQLDTEGYDARDAYECSVGINIDFLTKRGIAERELSARFQAAFDRVEKHPDAKVAMPFWSKALPMIYGKKP